MLKLLLASTELIRWRLSMRQTRRRVESTVVVAAIHVSGAIRVSDDVVAGVVVG